ncbi:M28 family peptidase [Leptolyngbya cf. ectocarpi LEGE 11479]|uniref:M28 family peptidase n=1 Tax=Leptolyngbya cf. ectocarpi LEGE 11479 TaxID=1828722 RepID=A0A929FAQ5_LEPEC|nr:M28 family peptidase [Leptolyngbya ectocarpi]MBE9068123.1 M28 family peptidase [Leptolyngbya cf. ectocarpi LEGE 11479]
MGNLFRRQAGLWLGMIALVIGIAVFYDISSEAQSGKLMVDNERLRSHLHTLATKRYTNLALARTRAYLTQQLKTYGYEPISQTFGAGNSAGTNLSIVRPGTQTPQQKILVGAHYDSVSGSPGADDNASGVATALEIARIFANYPTHKSLQVVFFDQEEFQPEGAGLVGSNAFVNNPANLDGLESSIILEMLGYACHEPGCQTYPPGLEQQNLPTQGDFIGVLGDTDHLDLLATFATEIENESTAPTETTLQAVTLPVAIGALPFMPDLFRSDHVPFWLKGIGAVMVSDTADFRNPNYHQESDTVESLDEVFLEQTANYIVERVEKLLQGS